MLYRMPNGVVDQASLFAVLVPILQRNVMVYSYHYTKFGMSAATCTTAFGNEEGAREMVITLLHIDYTVLPLIRASLQ